MTGTGSHSGRRERKTWKSAATVHGASEGNQMLPADWQSAAGWQPNAIRIFPFELGYSVKGLPSASRV